MAGVRVALVDVNLTVLPCVTFSTFAGVLIGTISALSAILAGGAGTLVDVHLTQIPRETFGALAVEGVDLIDTLAIVETRLAGTLIRVDVAEHTLVSWHADTVEASYLVQARGVIMARIRHAFIDVHLTARSLVSLKTLTLEGAFGVEAATTVFTRVGTKGALVNIQVAGRPGVTWRAGADCLAIDRVGVTVGALLTWIADAGIIKVAQQTCAPMRTLAEEGGYAVVAGGTVVTSRTGTVVDVLAAVIARPPVDTDAVIAAVGVVACSSILTRIGHQLTLIYIFCAVLTCVMRWTLAVVGVHTIHTHTAILAVVAWTVVNVMLTVLTCEAWQAAAIIGGVSLLDTGSSILAWRGAAWHVGGLTVLAGVLMRAAAVVRTHLIHTHAAVKTGRGSLGALVDILLAGLTVEGGWAGADVGGIEGRALAAVCARIGCTRVGELAAFT